METKLSEASIKSCESEVECSIIKESYAGFSGFSNDTFINFSDHSIALNTSTTSFTNNNSFLSFHPRHDSYACILPLGFSVPFSVDIKCISIISKRQIMMYFFSIFKTKFSNLSSFTCSTNQYFPIIVKNFLKAFQKNLFVVGLNNKLSFPA